MIGGGIRMIPEYTELFERIINVCNAESPGITFCFNTSPDDSGGVGASRQAVNVCDAIRASTSLGVSCRRS